MPKQVITVAMTGASGAPYTIELLRGLFAADIKVYFLISSAARVVLKTELNLSIPDDDQSLRQFLVDYFLISRSQLEVFSKEEWTAPVASGSNTTESMIICPCSMGTLSAIANGASNNLIERAADVIIKEKKQLILLTREMPLSVIHLTNMLRLSQIGVTIMPASPGFYQQPKTLKDLVNFVVARILDHINIQHTLIKPWGETGAECGVEKCP